MRTPRAAISAESNVAVVSLLQHKDVTLYLIAVKSFLKQIPTREVHIVDDGSLRDDDTSLIQFHIPGVTIRSYKEFANPNFPTGGCWERFPAILALTADSYVIQLDADTVTLSFLPEVAKCISDNRAFVLGTWRDQEIESMETRRRISRSLCQDDPRNKGRDIQYIAEANFNRISGYQSLRYVRGCAGFTGFPQGKNELELAERISRDMYDAIGDQWNDWGSEQVMSNIVVANQTQATVLPFPRYCHCKRIEESQTIFVHFIGFCRFSGTVYRDLALSVIRQLM